MNIDTFFLILAIYTITGLIFTAWWLAKIDHSCMDDDPFCPAKTVLFWPYFLIHLILIWQDVTRK